jgi:hypothetical protein
VPVQTTELVRRLQSIHIPQTTTQLVLFAVIALLTCRPAIAQTASGAGGVDPNAWMQAPPTSTGLAVGRKIPAFSLPDQNGKMQTFDTIKGPNGAAIYFMRSADW